LYYLYNNTSRNIPQDIFGKFDKKNKPIKAFGGFLFFISVKQPDHEGRRELLYKAQEIINEDLPYLFLYSPNKVLAINKEIQGVKPNPVNIYYDISDWWVDR